jgi:hypothetical protein
MVPNIDEPLFRPLKHNGKQCEERLGMDPDAINRVVWKYAGDRGLLGGLDARDLNHHRARKRRLARGRAEIRRTPRPGHDETVRSPRLQSGGGSVVFCDMIKYEMMLARFWPG